MTAISRGLAGIAGTAFLLVATASGAGAEENTVSAFSTVETQGNIVAGADGGFRIMGTVAGPFFVDAGQGPVDAGTMTCIADVRGESANGKLHGGGSCVLTAEDGAHLYADFTCEGVVFVGCTGDFIVVGGDGRLEGVTGGGRMTMRTSETTIGDAALAGMATSEGRGIVYWDEFVFVTP